MTKEQFEAHVRAEADVKYPVNHLIYLHAIYIAARMDHEWPLVEALKEAAEFLDGYANDESDETNSGMCSAFDRAANSARAALSPYTTKPIEP